MYIVTGTDKDKNKTPQHQPANALQISQLSKRRKINERKEKVINGTASNLIRPSTRLALPVSHRLLPRGWATPTGRWSLLWLHGIPTTAAAASSFHLLYVGSVLKWLCKVANAAGDISVAFHGKRYNWLDKKKKKRLSVAQLGMECVDRYLRRYLQ